jgi:hypothetical protein
MRVPGAGLEKGGFCILKYGNLKIRFLEKVISYVIE